MYREWPRISLLAISGPLTSQAVMMKCCLPSDLVQALSIVHDRNRPRRCG